jgi:hypothetical protein
MLADAQKSLLLFSNNLSILCSFRDIRLSHLHRVYGSAIGVSVTVGCGMGVGDKGVHPL